MSGKIQFKFQCLNQSEDEIAWTDCDDPTSDRRVMIGYQWMSCDLHPACSNHSGMNSQYAADCNKELLYLRCKDKVIILMYQ